jgi:hypothetical protein
MLKSLFSKDLAGICWKNLCIALIYKYFTSKSLFLKDLARINR